MFKYKHSGSAPSHTKKHFGTHGNYTRSPVRKSILVGSLILTVGVAGGLIVHSSSAATLPTVTPVWSDTFNQSMGVNTHFKDSTGDQLIYADKAAVAQKVKDLNVRIVRERMNLFTGQNQARDALRGTNIKWHVFLTSMSDYSQVMTNNAYLDNLLTKIAEEPEIYLSVANANEPNDEDTFSVQAKSLTNNVATLTVPAGHTMEVGEQIRVNGVDSVFNGTHILTAVSSTTVSYAKTNTNISSTSSGGTIIGHTYGAWHIKVANMQKRIWERKAVKSAQLTGQKKIDFDKISVVGPALKDMVADVEGDFRLLASVSNPKMSDYVDYGDIHMYPKGTAPTVGAQNRLDYNAYIYAAKKSYMTETGYNNGIELTTGGMGLPEEVTAYYSPKQYLDLFWLGYDKTFIYELLDSPAGTTSNAYEENFGLVGTPGFTPSTWYEKPAFQAIKLLGQRTADPGSPYSPPPIAVDIRPFNANPEVKWIIMGKRDGTTYAAIWRDVKIWNPIKKPTAGYPGSYANIGTVNVDIETTNGVISIPVAREYKWVQLYPTLREITSQNLVGDINNDGVVNVYDLSMLLSMWETADSRTDINKDGIVNIYDLTLLVSGWTK